MTLAKLVRAEPADASADLTNIDKVRGNVVLIERGGCSFTTKARRAEEAGAASMIVVNNNKVRFVCIFGSGLHGSSCPQRSAGGQEM